MKKNILIRVLIVCIAIMILEFYLANSYLSNVSMIVFFSFFFNVIIFSGLVVKSISEHRFSFEFIHSFFMLFMLTLAPMIQYYTTGCFLSYYASDYQILKTNSFILIWTLLFYCGRKSNKSNNITSYKNNQHSFQISKNLETILTILMVVLAVNKIRVDGFSFFRNSSAQTNFIGTGFTTLFFAIEVSVAMLAVSISIYRFKNSNKTPLFLFFNLAMCLIIAFPTAIPRFLAVTIYGGIILMMFNSLKKNYLYPLAILVGFIIVFPMLSSFRYERENVNLIELFKHVTSNFENEYNTLNYDGYMMLCRTMDYVSENHCLFGYALFGNILFFIPRSVWPTKPIGSGAFIAEYYNFTFTNCSESIIAESYLNFGIIGILLYAFILGKITQKIDALFWNKPKNIFIQLIYTFYIHIFLILLRGDFMTGFIYISVLTTVFYAFYKLFIINNLKTAKTNAVDVDSITETNSNAAGTLYDGVELIR